MFGSMYLHTSEFEPATGTTLPRLLSPRAIQVLLVLFPVASLILAAVLMVVKVDTVAQAQATVRPGGNPIRVPAPMGGKVAAVHVSEGDRVAAGTVVVSFDTTEARIRLQGFQEQKVKLLAALEQLTAKRLTLVTLGEKQQERARISVSTAQTEVVESNRSFEQALAQAREERALAFQDVELARRKFERLEQLKKDGVISEVALEEAKVQLVQAELKFKTAERKAADRSKANDLAQLKLAQEQKNVEVLQQEKAKTLDEIEAELIAAQKSLDQTSQDIQLAERTIAESEIRAPESGAVSALVVHHSGEFVSSGTVLCSIVPEQAEALVELVIPNLEMKNLKLGSEVKYSFDAYPAAEFGKAAGNIVKIAPDSTIIEGKSVYHAWASLNQIELNGSGQRKVTIRMGMTAQAEIVTERKPLLSIPSFQ
ncbi:MAG: HlyD family efflux transporter periplasmic adaptor subunit [Blastocatellia bacterium]|nr:HlyD family efflux transporter periplasmic adaptor subunit [Blastocatellia bacterium]